MKVLNSFSMNMLKAKDGCITYNKITKEYAKLLLEINGCEGRIINKTIADLISIDLQIDLNNKNIFTKLLFEEAIIANYIGKPVTEGALRIPKGGYFEYYLLSLITK